MNRRIAVVIVMVLISVCAVAQEQNYEVFGGYSLLRSSGGTSSGWDSEFSYKPSEQVSVVGSIGGYYHTEEQSFAIPGFPTISSKAKISNYLFLFGPRFYLTTSDQSKWTPFGHILLGGAHITSKVEITGLPTASGSANGFSMALGGGLDYKLDETFSIRPAMLEYVLVRVSGNTSNNLRYSAGIVLRF